MTVAPDRIVDAAPDWRQRPDGGYVGVIVCPDRGGIDRVCWATLGAYPTVLAATAAADDYLASTTALGASSAGTEQLWLERAGIVTGQEQLF